MTVKGRLRASARKKARKARKKGMFQRRKVCRFCADKGAVLDYKEVKTLRLFIYDKGMKVVVQDQTMVRFLLFLACIVWD